MGFLKDFGLVAEKKPPMVKNFSLYEKNTTTNLKQLAKNLKPLDRAKFFNVLREEGRWGKTSSNRQIIDTLKRRGESRIFRERIKDKVLTKHTSPGLSEEQIEHNIRLSNFDSIREQSQAKFGQGSNYQKESSLAGSYGKGEINATAKRPGATRQGRQYDQAGDKKNDIHLPV